MKEKTLLRELPKTKQNEAELLSVGSRLKIGDYEIHSKFRRVVNFIKENYLVSVVKEEIGGGPINIVIKDFPTDRIKKLSVEVGVVRINDVCFKINKKILYDGRIHFSYPFDKEIYKNNLNTLKNLVLSYSSEKSLAFLLDREREANFKGSFEKGFVERIKRGVERLFNKEIETGINLIKGVGFGLTPSGDDFISGVLSGLFILQNLFGFDFTHLREEIYNLSRTENLISSTFLYFSSRGEFFERVKNLITSIIYKGRVDVEKSFFKLIEVGDTSGSDIATGLFMTLEKGGEVWL